MMTDALFYITGGSDIGLFIYFNVVWWGFVIAFHFLSRPMDE